MKKNDTLNENLLKPKRQTIDFLLSYSKSIAVLKTKTKNQIVPKTNLKLIKFVLYENSAHFF